MPKPIVKNVGEKNELHLNVVSASPKKQSLQQMDKMKLDRLLRKPRSKEYMVAMQRLDAGGHVCNHHKANEIIDAIRKEFPEVEIEGILLGIVSKCYLGGQYEVHTIDMTGEIIEHYQKGQVLPGGMEKARNLALRGGYEFIEVYIDCCRCIGAGGNVAVVPC